VEFTIVILNECVASYPQIQWSEWKDRNRMMMKSQGDHWSKTTLNGDDIHDCLKTHRIDRSHLVQWKPSSDTLYRVSLPDETSV